MYTVYDSNGIYYVNVNDEAEADYIAYCIGGYYESNGETVYVCFDCDENFYECEVDD